MKPSFATDNGVRRVRLLSLSLDLFNQRSLNERAAAAVKAAEKVVIGHHNLHSLYLCHKMPVMKEFYDAADYVHIDGMSIVLLGKMLGFDFNKENRLTSLDWLLPLLDHCQASMESSLRVFLLGGKPGVSEIAAGCFQERIQKLEIAHHHGYFDMHDAAENEQVLEKINSFKPHLLLVGMGMPRQEEWIARNHGRVDCNITWSLGAFMDYYAGEIPVPPRWLGKIGLEWAFRLVAEPRRLWKRYLVEPWLILCLLMKEYLVNGNAGLAGKEK